MNEAVRTTLPQTGGFVDCGVWSIVTEDSTPRRRRKFFSCTRDQRTCVGSRPNGQGHVDCLSPRAHQKSLIRHMFRGILLESQFSSPSSFSSFCSIPPPAQTPLLNTSISQKPCATSQGGLLFGRLAEHSPLAGYEPNSLIEFGSEHTPINFLSRKARLQRSRDHGGCI